MDQEESENERSGDGIMGGGESPAAISFYGGGGTLGRDDQDMKIEKTRERGCGLVALYVDSSGGLGYFCIRNVSRSIPHVSDLFY
jgi:hypothetical protein